MLRLNHLTSFAASIVCAFTLSACSQQAAERLVTFSGPMMGTEYRVSVVIDNQRDTGKLEADIVAAMQDVNLRMSTYLVDSEISQINRLAAESPFAVSSELNLVLLEAQRVSELSEGAFDITLAKAINLWGFGPDGRITQRPNDTDLLKLQTSVGFKNLKLGDRLLTKAHADTSISLSAIAKGFAVDQVADVLQAQAITRYLINIGGELKAAGTKPDNSYWKVGIEKPHVLGGIQEVISLVDTAIATSGDYRNYHVIDGQHFSHTIDPSTLKPVFHRLALVSVMHPSAMTADALATAMMAMGEVQALEFANEYQLEVYLIIRDAQEGEYRIEMTESFRRNLQ